VGRTVLALQLLAQGVEATLRLRPEALRQPVERLDEDLRISEAAQGPRDLPVVVVLAPPGLIADLVAYQAERGANLLDVLARLVHCLGRLRPRRTAQLSDPIVDLRSEDPLHPRSDGLAREQAIGVGIEFGPGSVAAPQPADAVTGGRRGPGREEARRLARILHLRERPPGGLLDLLT
jgi:hypothetical protein